jgi:hypothetical protein
MSTSKGERKSKGSKRFSKKSKKPLDKWLNL